MNTDDRFREVAEKVISGEISQVVGSKMLGIPVTTLRFQLDKAYPDRPRGVRVTKARRQYPNGTGRPRKFDTVLENIVSDSEVCDMVKGLGRCEKCPNMDYVKGCLGCKGLITAMLKKVLK